MKLKISWFFGNELVFCIQLEISYLREKTAAQLTAAMPLIVIEAQGSPLSLRA
ncbi:MAG: hypothetical protein ACQEUT_16365 [Bacillota bacterium]